MNKMAQVSLLWLYTSRPLLYPLIPIIFSLGYQAGGGSLASWSYFEWLFVVALTWPFGMIIYGINDIYDTVIDTHDTNRSRIDGGRHTLSEQPQIWSGVAVATIILITCGVLAYGTGGVLFGLLVVGASVCYSVPPLRFKSRAGLDVLFSGLAYVVFVYGAGYWLMKPYTPLPDSVYVLAVIAAALHALGALRDYAVDKAAGVGTIAVKLGPRPTAVFIVLTTLLASQLWYRERGVDIAVMFVFVSILLPALLAILRPSEQMIRQSIRIVAFVIGCVGLFKILY